MDENTSFTWWDRVVIQKIADDHSISLEAAQQVFEARMWFEKMRPVVLTKKREDN
jgi:hypothetical protein